MSQFYNIQIKNKYFSTEDCSVIEFEIPEDLQSAFSFQAGQYLTLKANINGKEVRRSYSLCSSPSDTSWKVGVKAIENGVFSNYVKDELQVGDYLEVAAPEGSFVLGHNNYDEKQYVAFSAGSGITPVLSQVKEILENSDSSKVLLFFGNRNSKTVIFKDELEALKNRFLDRFSLYHILSKERISGDLFYGRINGEKCESFGKMFFRPTEVEKFMMCGPYEMTQNVKNYLLDNGVESSRVLLELFAPPETQQVKTVEIVDFDPKTQSKVTVKIDGDSFAFTLPFGGQNILDAAIDNGADLPFACKGGVCSTCKAKVTRGEVSMDINYALEPDEVERGYVLTCQGHPRSSDIVIDFDQKS